MVLPIQLTMLAKLFDASTPLYIVGGAVRNHLMGIGYEDFDICSAASIEDVKAWIAGTDYKIICEFTRTGTIVIQIDHLRFEYTRFRKDSYAKGVGSHLPNNVEFTHDISVDAKRRDFTCNAIYYDINKGKIIDPLNGVTDIKSSVIRTTRVPDSVLSEDALRIMRMVRLAMELSMDIDSACIDSAHKYAPLLQNISAERIRVEFDKILVADKKYIEVISKFLPSDGVKHLVDIGAMRYIVPELLDTIGCTQNPKYHINDVYLHTLAAIDYSQPHLRLLALLHDIAKPVLKRENGNTYGHERLGQVMATDIMKRLKYSVSDTERTSRLVGLHMFNVDNKTKASKCRRFIATNIDYIDDYLEFRYADGMATNSSNYDNSSAQRILTIKLEMLKNNLPMSITDLAVNGSDLLELGYIGKEIGIALKEIWLKSLDNNEVLSRQELLKKLSKRSVGN